MVNVNMRVMLSGEGSGRSTVRIQTLDPTKKKRVSASPLWRVTLGCYGHCFVPEEVSMVGPQVAYSKRLAVFS